MSRNHVETSIARAGVFVNLTVQIAAVVMIGLGYFTAVGRLAGVA